MPKPNRWLTHWLPCLLCMALIFYASSMPYHRQDLRPRLQHVVPVQFVEQHFSGVAFNYGHEEVSIHRLGVPGFVEFFIRKFAHLSIYWLLGLLFLRALDTGRRPRQVALLLTVAFCCAYAASDEVHQYFTGDRTPMVQDVVLDTIGATIGACVYLLFAEISRLFRRKNLAPPA